MTTTENYRQTILEFQCETSYANPFLDNTITATFTGPNGEVITREAYWDGGNTYKVSFAPISVGTWNYVLSALEETGLNKVSGNVESIPYAGDLDIYKHGFIKVSDDKHFFTYADGTPFFWLGDTHWEFSYGERWDDSNHPEMTSMFKGMIDRRFEQGYTVYQTNLRSDKPRGGQALYWKDNDVPNVEFFQNELDRRMYYLADKGIINALGFAWFMSVLGDIEHQKNQARYFIARYGALPMVWTLAGEVAGYDPNTRQACIDGWREVALYVQKLDSYNHLQTAHYTNERPFAEYYQDEEWHDFTLNQAGHGDYVVSANDYKEFLKKHNDKPFVEGEVLYEFCSTLEENGTRLCTAEMGRRAAYLSIQLGGCGFTYGAQGIWDNIYEPSDCDSRFNNTFNKYRITWAQAIDGEGGKQMGYMRKFYLDNKFWTLKPYDTGKETVGDPFGKKLPAITVSDDKKHWIMYYPAATRRNASIIGFNNATYTTCWYNPVTNEYGDTKEVVITNNSFDLPTKPDVLGDWLLIVNQKED